ncbi:hypothetical protein [Shinella zoogloeoides]|uniref:hypothetical protein n=1 Tax=Shinella zoogloeoides TaxID=352475 RepID=UPI00273D8922|nr:hypothetical protein [Shinella zoogloeoides]WLR91312.1 hypothetical protein Q9316_12415 [Shinella zoogloeoides]
MTNAAPARTRRFHLLWLLTAAAVAVFVGANAHLVYVAVSSEPGCVAHLKDKSGTPGGYRAAKSAC